MWTTFFVPEMPLIKAARPEPQARLPVVPPYRPVESKRTEIPRSNITRRETPQTNTKSDPPPAFAADAIQRVLIPQRCSHTDRDYVSMFRANRYSGQFIAEGVQTALDADGLPDALAAYDVAALPFRHLRCPFCNASAGPVRCGSCGLYLCEGGLNAARDHYVCSPSCGWAGPIREQIRIVHGAENLSARVRPAAAATMPLLANHAAPQLTARPSPRLLRGPGR